MTVKQSVGLQIFFVPNASKRFLPGASPSGFAGCAGFATEPEAADWALGGVQKALAANGVDGVLGGDAILGGLYVASLTCSQGSHVTKRIYPLILIFNI